MTETLTRGTRSERIEELRELGEAMMHCRAAYLQTFTSLKDRTVIARYYARLNRRATALSAAR